MQNLKYERDILWSKPQQCPRLDSQVQRSPSLPPAPLVCDSKTRPDRVLLLARPHVRHSSLGVVPRYAGLSIVRYVLWTSAIELAASFALPVIDACNYLLMPDNSESANERVYVSRAMDVPSPQRVKQHFKDARVKRVATSLFARAEGRRRKSRSDSVHNE
jgi:hypothetical protein